LKFIDKILKLWITSFLLISCAHKNESFEKKLNEYEYKNNQQITHYIKETIDKNNEFDTKTKKKLKTILLESLKVNIDLKKVESKLAQKLIDYTINKRSSYNDIVLIKKKMKENYLKKANNIAKTASQLKEVLKIYPQNQDFALQVRTMIHR
jgi:hypothetical protein